MLYSIVIWIFVTLSNVLITTELKKRTGVIIVSHTWISLYSVFLYDRLFKITHNNQTGLLISVFLAGLFSLFHMPLLKMYGQRTVLYISLFLHFLLQNFWISAYEFTGGIAGFAVSFSSGLLPYFVVVCSFFAFYLLLRKKRISNFQFLTLAKLGEISGTKGVPYNFIYSICFFILGVVVSSTAIIIAQMTGYLNFNIFNLNWIILILILSLIGATNIITAILLTVIYSIAKTLLTNQLFADISIGHLFDIIFLIVCLAVLIYKNNLNYDGSK